jgi:hypothetical protein
MPGRYLVARWLGSSGNDEETAHQPKLPTSPSWRGAGQASSRFRAIDIRVGESEGEVRGELRRPPGCAR